MNEVKNENAELELVRQFVRHIVFPVASFSVLIAVWVYCKNPITGIAAFCTFTGMLLPAWQLSSKSNVHSEGWSKLSNVEKHNLLFALAGVVLTAVGFGVGINTMFTN